LVELGPELGDVEVAGQLNDRSCRYAGRTRMDRQDARTGKSP